MSYIYYQRSRKIYPNVTFNSALSTLNFRRKIKMKIKNYLKQKLAINVNISASITEDVCNFGSWRWGHKPAARKWPSVVKKMIAVIVKSSEIVKYVLLDTQNLSNKVLSTFHTTICVGYKLKTCDEIYFEKNQKINLNCKIFLVSIVIFNF